jgi:hypothetical protein
MIDLTKDDVKKILGNKENAIDYLLCTKTGKTFKELKMLKSEDIYNLIFENLNYDVLHTYVRLTTMKKKYSSSNFLKYCEQYRQCTQKIKDIYNNNKEWAFNPSLYEDEQIKTIRKYETLDESIKNHLIKCEKNLIIKSYNNARSFLFEYFLIRNNDKILPTLSNSKGVDIYVEKRWDIKNTSGVTKQFKDFYGDEWKSIALNNPKIVAEYLYVNQGVERFDSNDRIFIIDLSDSINPISKINDICRNLNFNEVHEINFTKEINGIKNNYTANAMVLFL